ncbi:MAG: GGDEF domain-containing protein [Solirubrobacterales bacterium]
MSFAFASFRSDGNRALRATIAAVLFGGTALIALHNWLGLGSSIGDFVNGPLYAAVVLSAGLACLLRAFRGGPERAAWFVIAATILVQAATELYWTATFAGDPSPPYPSPADIGWLAFYPLAATGILLMVRARAKALDWRLWTDGLIAALGTAALGAAFVVEFVADRTSGSALQEAVTLAYPLGDICMLSLVVGIVALTRWRPGRTWSLLLLGLFALVFGDIASSLESSGLEISGEGWVTPIYMLGAICIGVEAWQPRAEPIRPATRFDDWQELVVPGFFAVVTIFLFVIQYVRATSIPTALLSAATILAIVARLAVSVLENKRLLEAVRTDPLTELGNQGGLRVDLEDRCRRAAEEPVVLLLLDLNGFKAYNDSFGHPAGDEMLGILGYQLRKAVGEDGVAYRVGGDEFAVLVECGKADVEAVTRRAAEALTANGDDFQLGAAWGAVAIPAEAQAPAVAMQLADERMYAQKQSRRLSRGRAQQPLATAG